MRNLLALTVPLALALGCHTESKTAENKVEPPQQATKKKPRRGILGQSAPKLAVPKWFNLEPDQAPPEVGDYAGKVVYLFFFQSW